MVFKLLAGQSNADQLRKSRDLSAAWAFGLM